MRVLHIVEVLHVDGRTTLLRDLVRKCGDGTEHFVLSLKWPGPLAADFEKLGVPVLALGFDRPHSHLLTKASMVLRARRLRPDVCVCWSGSANLVSLIPRVFGVPVIWTIHNSIDRWQGRLERLGMKLLSRLSSRVPVAAVCCSPATYRAYRDVHGFSKARLQLIENGVDTARFRPDAAARAATRMSLGIHGREIVVATAARMSGPDYQTQGDFKDIETLLRAFSLVRQQLGSVRFIVFGTNIDSRNAELVTLMRHLRLESSVQLLGFRRDVPALLAAADIYCMASTSGEGLPVALIEAMATGLIPVCTDSGSIRDALGDLGTLVQQKDAAALCQSIVDIAEMGDKDRAQYSARIVQHTRKHYGIESVAARYLELIQVAVRKSTSR